MSELAVGTPVSGDGPASSKKQGDRIRLNRSPATHWLPIFAEEDAFLQMLRLERKRSERSRKPFVFLLLDARRLLQSPQSETVFSQIVSALSSSMRETDAPGWYKDDSVVGMIFSEIAGDKHLARKVIRRKVLAALRARLDAQQLQEIRVSCEVFPEDWDEKKPWRACDSNVYPDLFREDRQKKLPRVIKGAIDILGSLLALILLSPLFLLIAMAIKLTSKGPVFFRQGRVGQYGVRFTFLKFRSMFVANDDRIHKDYVKRLIAGQAKAAKSPEEEPVVYKITQDPRVTWVGALLRKTSLDELPQFINVLRGEMSLVGPRPPVPYEVEAYDIWHRRRIMEAKPGITGLWQVTGRSRTSFDDMVRLDLQYVKTWSLWLDLKILLQTPRAVFSGDGAY